MLFFFENKTFIDTEKGLDISLPLSNDSKNPIAWYVEPPVFEPVRANGFIGSVEEGGAVNFRNIFFNPHGHGTHTECLGHITNEVFSVNKSLKSYFFKAKVLSIEPEKIENDLVITKKCFPEINGEIEAIIIRTLPNLETKKHQNYSASNPPYLDLDVIDLLEKHQVKHLLIDLPSVDKEEDGGVLAFHHAFWKVPENPQFDKTITELIYVSDEIKDGNYILNLQTAPFENDASPSRPVLFKIYT
jgi:arylformamidase